MYKDSLCEIPYDEIDFEIKELCRLINAVDGIETEESCFGHYKERCEIYLKVESVEVLNKFLFDYFDFDSLWHLEFCTLDVHTSWKDMHLILHSGDIKDFPTVDLMVDNLTKRFKLKVQRTEGTK
jgi:hypothetical protein